MTTVIRPPEPHELRAACDTMRAALMHGPSTDEDWEKHGASWDTGFDAVTAWEDDRCVAHAGAFRFDTTVPGSARLDTAGISRVGVLPTHTRQGLLTRMITELLEGGRARGQILASLRASEAVIYERYGFGVAGHFAAVKVDRSGTGAVHSPAEGTMRLLSRDELLKVVPDLYDRCARQRVGTISRPSWMWERYLEDALSGSKGSFVAVHDDSTGTPDGYTHYTVGWHEHPQTHAYPGTGEVHDLFGATPEIERSLWAYLIGIDLVEDWTSDERPLDDVARSALQNRRAYKVTSVDDEQWLRVLDLDVALGARTYGATDRSVTIQVHDPMFSANCGTWRIDSFGAFRSHNEPDLTVGIETISAAYLGGTSWNELAAAGRVRGRRPDAVADADLLFAHRPVPFCGSFF